MGSELFNMTTDLSKRMEDWCWVEQGDPEDYIGDNPNLGGFYQGQGKFSGYRIIQHRGNEYFYVLGQLRGEKEYIRTNIPYTDYFWDLEAKILEHKKAMRMEY